MWNGAASPGSGSGVPNLTAVQHKQKGKLSAAVLGLCEEERARCEHELLTAGTLLHLRNRSAWAQFSRTPSLGFLAVRGADGVCLAGMALDAVPSRSLPGHLFARVLFAGSGLEEEICSSALAELVRYVRSDRRVLRLTVEVFSRDAVARSMLGSTLLQHGFTRAVTTREYSETVGADLGGDELQLAALPRVRRNLKRLYRHPVAVRCITSKSDEPRMKNLLQETMIRTNGPNLEQRLKPSLNLSVEYPDLSRLVGLYRTDRNGPDNLLAFAWGINNGDHGAYFLGASTRTGDLGRLPLSYPLIWNLIEWARGLRLAWFDLGGITPGTAHSADPLGGISDFKRAFSKTVLEVREEWTLEPHPGRLAVSRTIARLAPAIASLLPVSRHRV
jgi:hypothetical protein